MYAKTLRHKQYPTMYGVLNETDISQSSIPELLPLTATLKCLEEYLLGTGQAELATQLQNYEMIVVKVEEPKFFCNSDHFSGESCAYQCENCKNIQTPQDYANRH